MQQRPWSMKHSRSLMAATLSLALAGCLEGTGEIGTDSPDQITAIGPAGVSSRSPGVMVVDEPKMPTPSPSTPDVTGMPAAPSVGMPDTTTPSPPAAQPPADPTPEPPPAAPMPEPPPAAPAPAAPAAMPTGTMVPLYTRPTDPSWAALIAAKQAHPTVPVLAVVNPSNGPGTSISKDYTDGINRLVGAGIRVIGYVWTSYGERNAADVRKDIDTWKSFYPQVTGIFFDEQSNKVGFESYYRDLTSYSRSHGLTFTIGNPGQDTKPSYIGTVDLILIYESSGIPDMSRLTGWHTEHDRRNFGVIPYGIGFDKNFVQAAKPYVSYIYLTSDVLPNPWDSLPSYFGDLMAALAAP